MIIIMEDSLNDEEHEKAIACMKEMNRVVDIPLMVGCLLYTSFITLGRLFCVDRDTFLCYYVTTLSQ